MSYANISAGKQVPDDINVVIEIPAMAAPVKYEVDKESDVLRVDRFLATPMFYPCNYGYIPQTLSEDGDPVDVLVITPVPLVHGSVIRCRPIGMMKMSDEAGIDNKLLAVPVDKLTPMYSHVKSFSDLPETLLHSLKHFFEHYKDLEKAKWVKVEEWVGVEAARQEILKSIERFSA